VSTNVLLLSVAHILTTSLSNRRVFEAKRVQPLSTKKVTRSEGGADGVEPYCTARCGWALRALRGQMAQSHHVRPGIGEHYVLFPSSNTNLSYSQIFVLTKDVLYHVATQYDCIEHQAVEPERSTSRTLYVFRSSSLFFFFFIRGWICHPHSRSTTELSSRLVWDPTIPAWNTKHKSL
jgi:hypothetical protein